ncbi:hypothetical protein [Corynebacterium kalidii]|uniref:Uncharacterized protein n=1 Tax=Corynebacterium kalidii TaxID=2931982 RepID=A0A9X2B1P7_9CORY|nr:hypothetical protein [Corynebacterium kalidii]MCJ7858284.1 hypothetical protein [Corynebacterium kalidii]
MMLNLPGSGAAEELSLTLTGAADGRAPSLASELRRTAAVATRALRMDSGAMARVVRVGDDTVDVIFSTPLGCIVAERVHAVPSVDDAVVLADPLPRVLAAAADAPAGTSVTLGGVVSLLWTGTAPPARGYTLVDTVPAGDVRGLFAGMQREADEYAGPAGLPPSLLDQTLLRLTGPTGSDTVEITGRVVAALGALGLVVEPKREELRAYDVIRVSTTGSWVRIDALFGSAYVPRPGGLARIPSPN